MLLALTQNVMNLRRNFRLADIITIANGICGSFSVFMSAKYLTTNDEDYLWSAIVFPLAGLLFDFMDGTVARWRNESSMLGQELDSLADLVRDVVHVKMAPHPNVIPFHFLVCLFISQRRYHSVSLHRCSRSMLASGHTLTPLSSPASSAVGWRV